MSAALTNRRANTAAIIPSEYETERRLNALLAENAEFERHKALYRTPREEIEALSMRRPLTPAQAYGLLGLFLGIFPPAAYFTRVNYGIIPGEHAALFYLLLFMNMICALVGWKIGKVFGANAHRLERASWHKMFLGIFLIALGWAAITGFAGGVLVLVIGGLFGIFFALPVALAAFPAFAVIHRLTERGGLIETKHLVPIAAGISLSISAFILGYR